MNTNIITVVGILVTNLVTNWTEQYTSTTLMWPPEANTTSHHEAGTVSEVISLQIQYNGKVHLVELTRKSIANGTRSYTEALEKHYSAENWTVWPTDSFDAILNESNHITSSNIIWSVVTNVINIPK